MKTFEAIEALKRGERIKRSPSDSPVDLCDHLGLSGFGDYFQLYHQDMVIRITCDRACSGTVKWIIPLEKFEKISSYAYLNFDLYEKPA